MINVNTKILGIIGHPLEHSLSPRLHNYYLKELALNYVYLPFDVKPQGFARVINGLKELNFKGANITIPYKERIIEHLDCIDKQAENIKAVNTIINIDGELHGYNTDASGFIRMLKEDGKFDIKDRKAIIVGAGGASKAVGFALCSQKIKEIFIINRTEERAQKLVKLWKSIYPELNINYGPLKDSKHKKMFKKYDLLVDTTPVGMSPHTDVKPVIPAEYLHPDLLVVDLVYNPLETVLLKEAKKKGAKTLNGMGMLFYQGIESFYLWTGVKPEDTGLEKGFFK